MPQKAYKGGFCHVMAFSFFFENYTPRSMDFIFGPFLVANTCYISWYHLYHQNDVIQILTQTNRISDIWKSMETKEKNWTKKESFETIIYWASTANNESLQARDSENNKNSEIQVTQFLGWFINVFWESEKDMSFQLSFQLRR